MLFPVVKLRRIDFGNKVLGRGDLPIDVRICVSNVFKLKYFEIENLRGARQIQ